MKEFSIENVRIVKPDCVVENGSIKVENGIITAIKERGSLSRSKGMDGDSRYLLPGLIDLHSDALEKTIEPRPGAVFPLDISIFSFDTILSSVGITTMFHCVSFMETDTHKREFRSNLKAQEMVGSINNLSHRLKIKNKIHARYDILNISAIDIIKNLIGKQDIHFLSVMDHTPGHR